MSKQKASLYILNLVFWFAIYIAPIIYGLISNKEEWKTFGIAWLIFGWLPLWFLAGYIEEVLGKVK